MLGRGCKIVATLGPASDAPEKLAMLIEAGAGCFRLNFSHGAHDEHRRRFDAIRQAERVAGRHVAVLADMQGPKIRVGAVKGDAMSLRYGQEVRVEASGEACDSNVIRAPHPELIAALDAGDIIKLDDGKLQLKIEGRSNDGLNARVEVGGVLTSRKGINAPGRELPISALTDKDKADLAFALEMGVDFIGLSFVQRAQDIADARALIGNRAAIVAKIEKPLALESLDDIIAQSDAVMVARGDLGVELAPEQVPIAQRRIVRTARAAGKPVIVATQMLESMIESPTPTRAEASDVATAVYQGADAVMLSAESAVGRHPATAVAIMDRIIRAVEDDPSHWETLRREIARPEPTTADAVAQSARSIADVLNCVAVVAYTSSGSTAQRVSRERPRSGVVALTPHPATARRLALSWGVESVIAADAASLEDMVVNAEQELRRLGAAKAGDRVVITAGIPVGASGRTNTIRILRLE